MYPTLVRNAVCLWLLLANCLVLNQVCWGQHQQKDKKNASSSSQLVMGEGGQETAILTRDVVTKGLEKRGQCWLAVKVDGLLTVSLEHLGIKASDLLGAQGLLVSMTFSGSTSGSSGQFKLLGPRGQLDVSGYWKDGGLELPTGLFALTGQLHRAAQFYQVVVPVPKGATVCNLSAQLWNKGTAPSPIVDEYGQRLDVQLPNRVNSAADLKSDNSKPRAQPVFKSSNMKFEKTGSFYIANDTVAGRLTLVDHAGNAFWSRGVTGVRTGLKAGCTEVIAANSALFQGLPPEDHPAWENDTWFSPYAYNVARKYATRADWEANTVRRLKLAGYNTIGNWSDTALCRNQRMPYVVALTTLVPGIKTHKGRFPDIYQKGFQDSLVKHWAPLIAFAKDDSLCIGVFVDNELPWENLNSNALPDGPGYEFAERMYVYNRRFIPHSDVKYLKQHQARLDQAGLDKDGLKRQFRGNWANNYFSNVREVLEGKFEWYKLYLGCRFTKKIPSKDVLSAAARYCDVLSMNIYDTIPHLADTLFKRARKPIIIGEFHTPLLTASHVQPNYKAFSMADVVRLRERYFAYLQSKPWCLGAHWYQWVDQPVTGRVGNGENQAVGLVDLQDRWK